MAIPTKVHPDVVDFLERLLIGAHRGDVTGIAIAATLRGGSYLTDVFGECRDRPTFARGAVMTLTDELGGLIHGTHPDERR